MMADVVQPSFEPILEVDNVTVRRNKADVIKDVNLVIHRGEFVGIVGPNGGGKSTLMQSVLGILRPVSGRIQLAGGPPQSRQAFGKIAWVSQAAAHIPKNIRLTVRELVSLGLLNHKNWFIPGRSAASAQTDRAIEMVGLTHLADRDVNNLSGGERQRAVIARALASEAEFLLLDEPMVGMDRTSRHALLKLLDDFCHNHNKTILMISHDVAAMRQTAHRMIYLEEQVLFDGPPPNFPSLEEIARLRGIQDVHGSHHYDHSAEHCGGGDHAWPASVIIQKEDE